MKAFTQAITGALLAAIVIVGTIGVVSFQLRTEPVNPYFGPAAAYPSLEDTVRPLYQVYDERYQEALDAYGDHMDAYETGNHHTTYATGQVYKAELAEWEEIRDLIRATR